MSKRSNGISRRRFVQGAAAAALPLIISTSSRGADAPSARLGLGFIGVGKQSLGHVHHFLGDKDVQVLAVCDVDTFRRDYAKEAVEKRYAEAMKSGTYKGCAAYNDFNELLARKDIDAVVIGTPDHWHTIPALAACKEKKDIYCEKPLTLTIHEGKTLIDAVRKTERVFQTGSQQRSSNEFRLACELVRSGRIGKLKAVYVNVGSPSKPCDLKEETLEPGLDWERWLGPAPMRPYNSVLSPRRMVVKDKDGKERVTPHNHFPNWRNYREYSGGMMTDWGAHHFDIAQWGLGMDESGPVEIIPPDDPKAERGVRYIYSNGVPVIHASEYEPKKNVNGVVFLGENGLIEVNRGHLRSDPGDIIKQPLGEKDVKLYKSPGHHRDWLNCIKTRKRPICDVEVGARSVTVCHLGNLAYWNHRKLKWDPKNWKFIDDEGANKWLDRERREKYQLPTV